MRKYSRNGQLETVVCNMCGKKIAVKEGIVREGAAMLDHAWDYFARAVMTSLSVSSGSPSMWRKKQSFCEEAETRTAMSKTGWPCHRAEKWLFCRKSRAGISQKPGRSGRVCS